MKNNNYHIVCNFDEKLISKFQNENIIIKTNGFDLLNRMHDIVNKENKLSNVMVFYDGALTSIRFLENWAKIPMTIYVTSMGSHKLLIKMLPVLKQGSLKVLLPANNRQNIVDVQIMASLGVLTGVYFTQKIEWERLNDLMLYSVYSKVNHAPVEPFHFISSRYKTDETLDFSAVYSQDPTSFFYVNSDGKVALSEKELEAGEFIADSINEIPNLKDNETYNKRLTSWQKHFLDKTVCSYCPAWRICLGKFIETINEKKECQQLFVELMEACEFHQNEKKNKNKQGKQQRNR